MNQQSSDPLFGGVEEGGGGCLVGGEAVPLPASLFELEEEEGGGCGNQTVNIDATEWPKFEAACDGEGSEVGNAKDWVSEGDNAKDWTSEGGNVEVDQTPLHNMIDKNKQSLATKLKLRRPMTVLVEQGIMPQYKTSPSLHEQKTKLERAQMGDRLRQKIASRPDRQELVHRHILEDVRPDVDPSLCSRQRQLKRAKLADSLATQLQHRPGPLELIQKNILHTDDPVEQMVKRGSIAFTPTALGVHAKDSSAESLSVGYEEDSNDTAPSPATDEALTTAPSPLTDSAIVSDLPSDSSCSNVPSLLAQFNNVPSSSLFDSGLSSAEQQRLQQQQQQSQHQEQEFAQPKSSRSESLGDITCTRPPVSLADQQLRLLSRSGSFGGSSGDFGGSSGDFGSGSSCFSPLPPPSAASSEPTAPVTSTPKQVSRLLELNGPSLQREAPGKDRKKIKVKKPGTAPKPRTIKFHEYRGPEPATKRKMEDRKGGSTTGDTAYDLLLKQQQLFLQWQLENQNKYPQILLPATSRSSLMSVGSSTSPSLIGSSSVSLNSGSQTSSSAPSPASSIPGTPRSNTPIRSMLLTPQDVNHATSLLNRLDDMKVAELKMELKKRGMVVSGSKPVLVDRLRPVLEEIIAAGRQQFQQPYKQISIPRGGLIILKPSPNSQLLTKPEPNSDIKPPGTPMHEGTPEAGDLDAPMTPYSPVTTTTPFSPATPAPYSPVSMLSPTNSTTREETRLEEILRESSPAVSNMDLEFNLNLMEPIESPRAPPPPPPPPPPDKRLKPAPLPPPPTPLAAASVSAPPPPPPIQFVPPAKTNQQIQLAKAQLESQLCPTGPAGNHPPPSSVRAGPKGQFIWPPVSVQSSSGTVTIRARTTTPTNLASDQRMSSTPVAQLAAVFSPSPPPLQPASTSTTGPPVQLSTSLQLTHSNSAPNLQLAAASSTASSGRISLTPPHPRNPGTIQLTEGGTFSFHLSRSGSLQLPAPSIQLPSHVKLPQEPVPAAELGLVVASSKATSLNTCSSNGSSSPAVFEVPACQLPATLPVSQPASAGQPNLNPPLQSPPTADQLIANPQQQPRSISDQLIANKPPITAGQPITNPQQQQLLVSSSCSSNTQYTSSPNQPINAEDILKTITEQQRQIEELKGALLRSQEQLKQTQLLQQSPNTKAVLARQLQKKQLSNQIQQLQQQLVHKAQEQQAVVSFVSGSQPSTAAAVNGFAATNQVSNGEGSNQTIDDVLDIILRNGYTDTQHQQQPGPHPSQNVPPPPPPPPGSSQPSITTGQPPSTILSQPHVLASHQQPPVTINGGLDLQLDFGDISFDLGQLPELGWAEGKTDTTCSSSTTNQQTDEQMEEEDGMEVDMDVADWLDSLLPSTVQPNSFGM